MRRQGDSAAADSGVEEEVSGAADLPEEDSEAAVLPAADSEVGLLAAGSGPPES